MRTEFEQFLKFHECDSYIRDYGHGVISYSALDEVYSLWCFVAVEQLERMKMFYFNGTNNAFEKRVSYLLSALTYTYDRMMHASKSRPRVWSVGYIPCLFTVDFSKDPLANAIRSDFFKHDKRWISETNDLDGLVVNSQQISLPYFNKSRQLDFDFSKWLLKRKKAASKNVACTIYDTIY